MDDNITLEQLEDFARRADERLDRVEGAVLPIRAGLTIPASSWVDNDDPTTLAAGYRYRADVPLEGLTASDETHTTLDIFAEKAAMLCGMSGVSTSLAGAVRYYAMAKPEADMAARVTINTAQGT